MLPWSKAILQGLHACKIFNLFHSSTVVSVLTFEDPNQRDV